MFCVIRSQSCCDALLSCFGTKAAVVVCTNLVHVKLSIFEYPTKSSRLPEATVTVRDLSG